VDPGSRKENASKKEATSKTPVRIARTGASLAQPIRDQ